MSKSPLEQQVGPIVAFVASLWVVWLADIVLPLGMFGLVPRAISGLPGIVAMPFLHSGLGHLVGNTLPLMVLLTLLAGTRERGWQIVGAIVLLGGILLWIFGRPALHVGASGLVFGLAAFLIAAGLIERRFLSIAISFAVALAYGSSLLLGVLPLERGVSWDGHLAGAIAGGAVAYRFLRSGS